MSHPRNSPKHKYFRRPCKKCDEMFRPTSANQRQCDVCTSLSAKLRGQKRRKYKTDRLTRLVQDINRYCNKVQHKESLDSARLLKKDSILASDKGEE